MEAKVLNIFQIVFHMTSIKKTLGQFIEGVDITRYPF